MKLLIQGNFNVTGSYGRVNNAIAQYFQKIRPEWEVVCDSWDGPLAETMNPWGMKGEKPDVVIRQIWPPQFRHWPDGATRIVIQPWEYGAVPLEWIQSMEDVDWIWVPSSSVKEGWIQSGASPHKIRIIPNGIDSVLPHLPDKKSAPFTFLFIGGPIYRKGIDLVFEALSRAFPNPDPDIQLVIKATGEESFYQGQSLLGELLERYEPWCNNIVIVSEFLSDDEITKMIDSAHVLIHPYRGEGFGLPILEAMARGTLVLTTEGGGASDFANRETVIVVPSEQRFCGYTVVTMKLASMGYLREPDVQALAESMREANEHYETFLPKRANALQMARNYLWDRCVQLMVEQIEIPGRAGLSDSFDEIAKELDEWANTATASNSLSLVSQLLSIGDYPSAYLAFMGSPLFNDKRFEEVPKKLENASTGMMDFWIKGYFRQHLRQVVIQENKKPLNQSSQPTSLIGDLSVITMNPLRWTEVDSWHGHIPFAALLVHLAEPKVFVELGTHKGDSYFGFCQAVHELGLETQCYAVDTWAGDQHAGYYDESVFFEVSNYNAILYSEMSTLVRSTFAQALTQFDDGTIDILHIDGEHTYYAAQRDFVSWLPKMSRQGIIIFHDIDEVDNGFGVWRLWEQLKARYPYVEFRHSHGLGVLFVGSEFSNRLDHLMRLSNEDLHGLQALIRHTGESIVKLDPAVSIIIAQYGHSAMTIDCIYSLLSHVNSSQIDIVVVDDCSPDNSFEIVDERFRNYPNITVVRNPHNGGFSVACNRGAALGRGPILVFLNNDTVSTMDWLSPMLKVITNTPDVGVVGAKIIYPNGKLQHSGVIFQNGGYFPLDPVTRGWNQEADQYPDGEVVTAVIGACLMIRRNLFNLIGGFDENYYMSYEDVDLCLKTESMGFKVWYEASAVIVHRESISRNVPERPQRDLANVNLLNAKWLGTEFLSLKFDIKSRGSGLGPITFGIIGDCDLHRVWQMVQEIGALLMDQDRVMCQLVATTLHSVRALFMHLSRNHPEMFFVIGEGQEIPYKGPIIYWNEQMGPKMSSVQLESLRKDSTMNDFQEMFEG